MSSFWLAQSTRKLLLDHLGKSSVYCNRYPYLRPRNTVTSTKLERLLLCSDDGLFIMAF